MMMTGKQFCRSIKHSANPDADAIADLAVENFTEMRDRTADPKFLLQKKLEARLHEKYPEKWIPAYTQVTFSPNIRYSDGLKRSSRQEKIMQEIMRTPDIKKKWKNEEIEQLIYQNYSSFFLLHILVPIFKIPISDFEF